MMNCEKNGYLRKKMSGSSQLVLSQTLNQGYALDEHGITCSNIDECSILTDVCGNGTCIDVPGSFTCQCDPGFEVTPMMQVYL